MRREYPADTFQEPFDNIPPGFPAVKGILKPVIEPFFGQGRQVRGIEEDQIKRSPYPAKEIRPDHLNTFLPGSVKSVWIDIRCHNPVTPGKPGRNGARARTYLQHPVTGLYFALCDLQQQEGVRFRLVDLGGVEGHYRNHRKDGAKRDCLFTGAGA